MTALACTGQPISWPRLERFAAGAVPRADAAAITTHLAACPACAQCLAAITTDVVALPALPALAARAPAPAPRRRWWRWPWLAPAFALAAAAVVVLVVRARQPATAREDRVAIKGVGEVVIDVVRERAGVIRQDVRSFAPGDRWKVVVTCPPAAAATFEVAVADGTTIDRPLAPVRLACGNRVVVPGAFTVTGAAANRVCVRVTPEGDAADAGTACVTLTPE